MAVAKGIFLPVIFLLFGISLTSCLISDRPFITTSDRPFSSWTLLQQGGYDNVTREWQAGPAASITTEPDGYLFQSKNPRLGFGNSHFRLKQLTSTIYVVQTSDPVKLGTDKPHYIYGAILLDGNLIYLRTYENAHTCEDVFLRDQITRLGLLPGPPREDFDLQLQKITVPDCIVPSPNALATLVLEDVIHNKRSDWYAFKVLKIS